MGAIRRCVACCQYMHAALPPPPARRREPCLWPGTKEMESRMGTDCKNNPPPCSGVAGIRVQIHKAYPCLSARPAVDLEGVGAFSHVGDIAASLGVDVYGVWKLLAGWAMTLFWLCISKPPSRLKEWP
ncbi:hypothetical protein J3E69DRAFT_332554 [Trichoderma sp. SZMC 28015]